MIFFLFKILSWTPPDHGPGAGDFFSSNIIIYTPVHWSTCTVPGTREYLPGIRVLVPAPALRALLRLLLTPHDSLHWRTTQFLELEGEGTESEDWKTVKLLF